MNACTPCLIKSFVFPDGQNGRDKRPCRRAVVCLRGPRQMLRELRRVGEIMQIFEKTMHPVSAGTSTTPTRCPADGKCAPGSYITGIANTGQGASCSTRSVTLPRSASNRPWRPAVGMATISAPISSATETIVSTTGPFRTSTVPSNSLAFSGVEEPTWSGRARAPGSGEPLEGRDPLPGVPMGHGAVDRQ
jgi:hypothetical protein